MSKTSGFNVINELADKNLITKVQFDVSNENWAHVAKVMNIEFSIAPKSNARKNPGIVLAKGQKPTVEQVHPEDINKYMLVYYSSTDDVYGTGVVTNFKEDNPEQFLKVFRPIYAALTGFDPFTKYPTDIQEDGSATLKSDKKVKFATMEDYIKYLIGTISEQVKAENPLVWLKLRRDSGNDMPKYRNNLIYGYGNFIAPYDETGIPAYMTKGANEVFEATSVEMDKTIPGAPVGAIKTPGVSMFKKPGQ